MLVLYGHLFSSYAWKALIPLYANPHDCPRLRECRAHLLALPPVARCIDEARPYRHYFPVGAPDRD